MHYDILDVLKLEDSNVIIREVELLACDIDITKASFIIKILTLGYVRRF